MKKTILSLTMGAALLIAPMTASALTPMTSDSLKDATGQAGVSIALDNIVIYQSVGETLYTDTDGYYDMDKAPLGNGMGGLAEGTDLDASVFIGEKEKLTVINAILDDTNRGGILSRAYGNNEVVGNTTFGDYGIEQGDIRPLNIDVASRLPILSPGMMFNATGLAVGAAQDGAVAASDAVLANSQADYITNSVALAFTNSGVGGAQTDWENLDSTTLDPVAADGSYLTNGELATATATATYSAMEDVATAYGATQVAGVVIGLPTVEIQTTSDSYSVGIKATGAHNDGKTFIKITKGASVMAVLGGTIEIAAH